MSKHTKGPWNVDFIDGVDGVFAEGDKRICQVNEVDIVGWNARFRDESEANARLIAAAPDLLQELKRMVDNAEQAAEEDWIERVRPHGDCTQVRWQFEESSDYQDFLEEWKTQIAAIAKATPNAPLRIHTLEARYGSW